MIIVTLNHKVHELQEKLEKAEQRILELEAKLQLQRELLARAAGAMDTLQHFREIGFHPDYRNAEVDDLIDKIRATYGH